MLQYFPQSNFFCIFYLANQLPRQTWYETVGFHIWCRLHGAVTEHTKSEKHKRERFTKALKMTWPVDAFYLVISTDVVIKRAFHMASVCADHEAHKHCVDLATF